jgi:electron transport complex protein RnfA
MRVNPLIKSFKGLPILLIILGLIALVFSGLAGLF